MITLRIFYEGNQKRDWICDDHDEMSWLLKEMFGDNMGTVVEKVLDRDLRMNLYSELDRFFDEHLCVLAIQADPNYKIEPDLNTTINKEVSEDGPERTETEDLPLS